MLRRRRLHVSDLGTAKKLPYHLEPHERKHPDKLLAEAIDKMAEGASGYQVDDHDRIAIRRTPSGLAAADMTSAQQALLYELVAVYESKAPDGVLPRTPASLDGVHFGWAGPLDAGKPSAA